MRYIEISETRDEIFALQNRHLHMRDRLRCLDILRSKLCSVSDIDRLADILGADEHDIVRWIDLYRIGGIELLLDTRTLHIPSGPRGSLLISAIAHQQSRRGRQLPPQPIVTETTGPYYYNGDMETDRRLIGSGQCVALVRELARAPHTSFWRRGDQVEGNPNMQRGVAIASGWDEQGRYRSRRHGNHAALFIEFYEYTEERRNKRTGVERILHKGMYVYDQWVTRGKAGKRFIEFLGGTNDPSNNGSCFYIIK
jgi:hypothetical protein